MLTPAEGILKLHPWPPGIFGPLPSPVWPAVLQDCETSPPPDRLRGIPSLDSLFTHWSNPRFRRFLRFKHGGPNLKRSLMEEVDFDLLRFENGDCPDAVLIGSKLVFHACALKRLTAAADGRFRCLMTREVVKWPCLYEEGRVGDADWCNNRKHCVAVSMEAPAWPPDYNWDFIVCLLII